MLAPNVTAKFTAYKYKDYTVRVHINTEDSSVWVVAKDVLKIINKSNPSYYVHRLNKDSVHKHLINTAQGKQTVLWVNVEALNNLDDLYLSDFLLWLKHTVNAKLIGSNNYKQIFKEPITVERKDLENLIMLANKLSQYL